MDLFNTKTYKAKTNLLLGLSFLVVTFAFSTSVMAKDKAEHRIPTEDLVEGIKSRDGRWFEVEMIIFKRNDNIDLREHFSQNVKSLITPRQWDLVRDELKTDVSMYLATLPQCHKDKNPLEDTIENSYLSPQDFYKKMMDYQTLINSKWQFTNELCLMPKESLSGYWQLVNQVPNNKQQLDSKLTLDEVPVLVTGEDYDDFSNVYVLAEKNLQLTAQFNKLKRNPNTEPMLHIGWRQPGLSKRNARAVYLVAGESYTERFKYDGVERLDFIKSAQSTSVNANSEQALGPLQDDADEQNKPKNSAEHFIKKIQSGAVVDFKNKTLVYPKPNNLPDETWELDGFIKVHLDHYLYLEGQFNFRELSKEIIDPEAFLAQLTTDKALESAKQQNDIADDLDSSGLDSSGLASDDQSLENEVTADASEDIANKEQEPEKELVTINYLKNYNFKQTRKSYSGDLHYLDHPKMGILIQIRKYRH